MNNNKGFTLLEAMVSIAVLALLSAFILEMFIVSAGANRRAQTMDEAGAEAVSVIDMFQAGATPDAFLGNELLAGAHISAHNDDGLTLYAITKQYPGFALEMTLTPALTAKDDTTGFDGALYELTVRAEDTSPKVNRYAKDDGEGRALVEYSAKKYFDLSAAR